MRGRGGALLLVAVVCLYASLCPAAGAGQIGRVLTVKGDVLILPGGELPGNPARASDALRAEDFIRTGEDGMAKVMLANDEIMIVAENTEVDLSGYSIEGAEEKKPHVIRIIDGTGRFILRKSYSEYRLFEVHTSNAFAGVVGTDFVSEYSRADEATTVTVLRGTVLVKSLYPEIAGEQMLEENTFTRIVGREPPIRPMLLEPVMKQEILKNLVLNEKVSHIPFSPGTTAIRTASRRRARPGLGRDAAPAASLSEAVSPGEAVPKPRTIQKEGELAAAVDNLREVDAHLTATKDISVTNLKDTALSANLAASAAQPSVLLTTTAVSPKEVTELRPPSPGQTGLAINNVPISTKPILSQPGPKIHNVPMGVRPQSNTTGLTTNISPQANIVKPRPMPVRPRPNIQPRPVIDKPTIVFNANSTNISPKGPTLQSPVKDPNPRK